MFKITFWILIAIGILNTIQSLDRIKILEQKVEKLERFKRQSDHYHTWENRDSFNWMTASCLKKGKRWNEQD